MAKRFGWAALLAAFLLAPLAAGAQERNGFDQVVDFSVTLKTLALNAGNPQADFAQQEKYLILNGTITGIQLLDPEQATFRARVELVTGEWDGLEEVRSYRCFVLFEGPEFFRLLPKRKNPASAVQVGVTDRVIVVARAIEPLADPSGGADWLLRGFHLRLLR